MLKKIFILVAVGFMGPWFPLSAAVVEDLLPLSASQHLGESLNELKTSVSSLEAGNQNLMDANARLKAHLDAMQLRVRDLMLQENQMAEEAEKLKALRDPLSRQIAQMEKENFTIDAKLESLTADGPVTRERIARAQKQDMELSERMGTMGLRIQEEVAVNPFSSQSTQKERLKLLKMIDESKKIQQRLTQQLFDQRKISGPPAVQKTVLGGPWSGAQLDQLEAQIRQMNKNHEKLQELGLKMQERLGKTEITPSDRTEQNKLRSTLEGMSKAGKELKTEIRVLRKQMVELDKRKSHLETLLP